ncbi:MAG: hypothetical protein L0K86_16285 [Actinomycetia bacterium]|nr:hypothetical protein [Actinomycetes bacterium]
MTTTATSPAATAAEVLAQLDAASAATLAAIDAHDDAATAECYRREADVWQQLRDSGLRGVDEPSRRLLVRAAADARAYNADLARRYRGWAASAT